MIAKTNEVFKKMDLDLDPRIMVRDLDASYKQIVEIARALLLEATHHHHGRADHFADGGGDSTACSI